MKYNMVKIVSIQINHIGIILQRLWNMVNMNKQ